MVVLETWQPSRTDGFKSRFLNSLREFDRCLCLPLFVWLTTGKFCSEAEVTYFPP